MHETWVGKWKSCKQVRQTSLTSLNCFSVARHT